MIALPVYLRMFGIEGLVLESGPFVDALVWMILLPLGAAVVTQLLALPWLSQIGEAMMVPLMMATLIGVVASQIGGVGLQWRGLMAVVPLAAVFAVVMAACGLGAARMTGMDRSGGVAVAFSGATRNSLVMLPLALALPRGFELAPLVVVTQTLTELILMVIFVRLLPKLAGMTG